jgi:hypothetical protein
MQRVTGCVVVGLKDRPTVCDATHTQIGLEETPSKQIFAIVCRLLSVPGWRVQNVIVVWCQQVIIWNKRFDEPPYSPRDTLSRVLVDPDVEPSEVPHCGA